MLSVPSTSGLRDETFQPRYHPNLSAPFQYPQPRVYAMKQIIHYKKHSSPLDLSVPSTSGLRDETALAQHPLSVASPKLSVPSTSGLRDETATATEEELVQVNFQYPQPRVYAMKLDVGDYLLMPNNTFSTLNLGPTRCN